MCLVGCGGAMRQDVGDLRHRLDETQRREVEARRRVDDLENRLFLLEDRVDTARVAQERVRAPELPVVRVSPAPAATPAAPAADAAEAPASEIVTDPVVYEGDALGDAPSAAGARPILRFAAGAGVRPGADAPMASTRLASVDRIPVVPLPDGRKAAPSALELYRKAHDALGQGRYDEALAQFRGFLASYPRHDYADNAAYWAGECLYARRDYTRALQSFRDTVERYPSGNKAPDALLKAGYTYVALGDRVSARAALEEVVRAYPRAEAARLAEGKLRELAP